MSDVNTTTIAGRLANEVQYLPARDGKSSRASGWLANNHRPDGKPDYYYFVCWGDKADALIKWTHKGKELTLVGPLRTRLIRKGNLQYTQTEIWPKEIHYGHDSQTHQKMQQIQSGVIDPTQISQLKNMLQQSFDKAAPVAARIPNTENPFE